GDENYSVPSRLKMVLARCVVQQRNGGLRIGHFPDQLLIPLVLERHHDAALGVALRGAVLRLRARNIKARRLFWGAGYHDRIGNPGLEPLPRVRMSREDGQSSEYRPAGPVRRRRGTVLLARATGGPQAGTYVPCGRRSLGHIAGLRTFHADIGIRYRSCALTPHWPDTADS